MNARGDSDGSLSENDEHVERLADSDHDFAAVARVFLAIERGEDPDPDDLAKTHETVQPFIDTDGTAAREQYLRAAVAGFDRTVSAGERRAFAAAVRDAIRREQRAERERAEVPVDFQMYRVESGENTDGDPESVGASEVGE